MPFSTLGYSKKKGAAFVVNTPRSTLFVKPLAPCFIGETLRSDDEDVGPKIGRVLDGTTHHDAFTASVNIYLAFLPT